MKYKSIKIKYFTLPEGVDFECFDEFVNNINQNYFLSVNKKRTDTLGGGLYELIIEISENLSLMELSKSYAEDGVKLYIGYAVKEIYASLKTLFKKNQNLQPAIEKISLQFKDCKVIFYEVYKNGIEDNFEDVINKLIEFTSKNKKLFKKIEKVHLPIFNHTDYEKLCDYRVKLNVDETITKFRKDDYLKFWGFSSKNKKQVFDVEKDEIIDKKYYTQKAYDKLYYKKKK